MNKCKSLWERKQAKYASKILVKVLVKSATRKKRFLGEGANIKCFKGPPKATHEFTYKEELCSLTHSESTCEDKVLKAHGALPHRSASVLQQQQSKSLERQMDEVLQLLPHVNRSSKLVRDEIRGLLGEVRRVLFSKPEDGVAHSIEQPSLLAKRKRKSNNGNGCDKTFQQVANETQNQLPTLEEASADCHHQQGTLTQTEEVKFASWSSINYIVY